MPFVGSDGTATVRRCIHRYIQPSACMYDDSMLASRAKTIAHLVSGIQFVLLLLLSLSLLLI